MLLRRSGGGSPTPCGRATRSRGSAATSSDPARRSRGRGRRPRGRRAMRRRSRRRSGARAAPARRSKLGIAVHPEHGRGPRRSCCSKRTSRCTTPRPAAAATPSTPASATRIPAARLALAQSCPRALAGGQIEIFLQPKAEPVTGGSSGAEALVRWRHPEQGLLPPSAVRRTGRAIGARARAHPLRARPGARAVRSLAGGGARPARCGQRDRHGSARHGAARVRWPPRWPSTGCPRRRWSRAHRELRALGPRPASAAVLACPARAGHRRLARRLRDGLLGADPPSRPAGDRGEDRPLLRELDADRAAPTPPSSKLPSGWPQRIGIVAVAEGVEDECHLEAPRRPGV